MKTRLSFLMVLTMLMSLLFKPGAVLAQSSAPGTVVAWGWNNLGQSSVPSDLNVATVIAAGMAHSLALKADGTVVAWGSNYQGQSSVPAGLTGVTAIAAGGYHSLALKADGTVVAWGLNNGGQINIPAGLSGVIAIAAGAYHNLALKADGTVVAWGWNNYGQINLPAGLSGVIAIAAGGYHNLALKADGTVVAWGLNDVGQSSVPAGLSAVTGIAAGGNHSLALKADGTVAAWGLNDLGQINVPAGLNGVTSIAAGGDHNLALKGDGTVVAWGWNGYGQTNIPAGLNGVTAIAAGGDHSLALISSPPTDLAITQTADQATVSTGDPVGFTITIANNSSATANMVTLSDPLPVYPELSWSIGGTDAAACTITGGIVSCNFGDLLPGGVKTIRLTSPTQYIGGKGFCPTINSTATVMAANQPEDKSAIASVSVLCPFTNIYVWPDTPNVIAGEPVRFTVTVDSMGEGIARDVEVYVGLPTNPGLSWSITNVTPASLADKCSIEADGSYLYLWCVFDQMAPMEEIFITVTSPTTSDSCGQLVAAGSVRPSNGPGIKGKAGGIIVSCTVGNTVQPGEAATLTLPGSRGQIEFPANLVSEPTNFTYTEQDAPSQDLGSNSFAGLSFTLDATDTAGNPVTSFPASYTTRLTYQDSDWESAGIADESLLNLAYWDTANGRWVNVLPCEGCSLDTEQNQLVVVLNHLTEFALLAPPDTTPPTTSATLSPDAGASGWYAEPASVTLKASDSESGIHNTEYNLNGAGWTTYNAPFVVSSESTSSTVHNTVQYRSTDEVGNVEEAKSLTIQMDTTPPTVGASVPLSGNEVQGGIKFSVNLADALSGPASAMLSIREADGASGKEIGHENLATVYNSTSGNWELAQHFDTTQLTDGSYVLVAAGKDVAGNEKTEIIPFSVRNNTAPTPNPGGPYLGAVNTAINFDGSLSSDPDGDTLTHAWDFGDGATGTGATPTHSYTATGVFNVCLRVNDGSLSSSLVCTFAVVYDPSAGFVTGGGWIDSPAGPYKADENLTGKATFGFMAKYQKGASVPIGTTAFQFDLAGLSFSSQSYEWLVVNQAGTNAQFKGSGLINGLMDDNGNAYKFMLWAGDGSGANGADTFRIRIWWEDAAGEQVVYDNGVDQAIEAGNIVVHTGK